MNRSVLAPPEIGVPLLALALRQKARVIGFDLPSDRRARLLEMGLTTGTVVQLIRFAPMGDPLEIELRGYRLSLRKREAMGILVVCEKEASKFPR